MSGELQGDWMTPDEAARYLSVSKQTVRALVKRGQLTASKIGYRTLRISTASLERMMEATKTASLK
jgi:excisionase family DNA binding protein